MIFVLLLCGPPGVGKSTVALKVSKLIEQRNSSEECTSILFTTLEFDKIETDRDLWDENSFRTTRESGLLQLQVMIRTATLNAPTSHTVIIVDDIMYLHSMRRAIYVICRDLNVHHLMIVRVFADLELAMSRNSSRLNSSRISDETMRKIFSRFEEPNKSLVHERHSFLVDNSCYQSSDIELAALIDAIETKITEESMVPIPAEVILGGCVESTKEAASKQVLDAVSEVDLVLRKLVSSFLRGLSDLEDMKNLPSIRSEMSKVACEVKAIVLERVRNNKHRIGSDNLSTALSSNNKDCRHCDSIISDSTAGAVCSEREGEGVRMPSVKVSCHRENDVIPPQDATFFYDKLFCEILSTKIENFFGSDSAVCPCEDTITIALHATNTTIRDNILDLLQLNCESFPA